MSKNPRMPENSSSESELFPEYFSFPNSLYVRDFLSMIKQDLLASFFCHLCSFPLTIFTCKTCESNSVCFLFVLALEYPNLDISETTRDYWVITGNFLFISPFILSSWLVFLKLHIKKIKNKK